MLLLRDKEFNAKCCQMAFCDPWLTTLL